MTNDDKAQLAEKLGNLGIAFGNDFSEARIAIYIEQLSDLPIPTVLHAIEQSLRTQEFFPTIAVLRKLAGEGVVNPKDEANERWYALRRLSGGRAYCETALADPITRICFLRMGGIGAFGLWDFERHEDFKRKEFCDMYQALFHRQQMLALPAVEATKRLDAGFTERGVA